MNGPRTTAVGKIGGVLRARQAPTRHLLCPDRVTVSRPRLDAEGKPQGNRKERRIAARIMTDGQKGRLIIHVLVAVMCGTMSVAGIANPAGGKSLIALNAFVCGMNVVLAVAVLRGGRS